MVNRGCKYKIELNPTNKTNPFLVEITNLRFYHTFRPHHIDLEHNYGAKKDGML